MISCSLSPRMRRGLLVCGLLAGFGLGCASSLDSALDAARSALDAGDYATAITQAQAALAAVPGDFDATMALSVAQAGRAGVNLLDLTQQLTDSDASNTFSGVHGVFLNTFYDDTATADLDGLTDLRAAIVTLTGFSGVASLTSDELAEYSYQLGILQAVELFSMPTILAQPTATATVDTSDIATADLTNILADFIAVDNNLIAGGIGSTNDLITTIQRNYCALADISAGSGFTLGELRALTACQLSDNPDSLAAGDLDGAVANCAAFDFDCTAANTAL